jgi:hypothetical protein
MRQRNSIGHMVRQAGTTFVEFGHETIIESVLYSPTGTSYISQSGGIVRRNVDRVQSNVEMSLPGMKTRKSSPIWYSLGAQAIVLVSAQKSLHRAPSLAEFFRHRENAYLGCTPLSACCQK